MATAVKAQTPVVTPKNQVVLKLDNTGNKTVSYTDIADISGLTANSTVTVSPASLNCSSLGNQIINITASNGPGNTTVQPVSVIVATTPTFSSYPNATIAADNNCKATLPDYVTNAHVTDICPAAVLTVKQIPAPGTPLTVNQPTAVSLIAGDQYGGTSAVFFTVTSYSSPVITPVAGPVKFTLDVNGNYTITPADLGTVTTCDNIAPTITISPQNLTCANLGNQTIIFTASTIRPNPQAVSFSVPTDVATDANGVMYVADGYSCSIRKITPDGTVTTFAGGICGYADGAGAAAQFKVVNGITIDQQGNLYVIDENNRVRKITPDGTVTTLAGSGQNKSEDGTGTSASLSGPRGITIDGSGNLYITQNDFLIRKVTPAGVVTTVTGPPSVSKLNTPIGITVDGAGNLYVTDYTSAIKKIAPDGTITIVAGHDGSGFADGTGAAASFNQPKGITIDNSGNLYVTDSENNAIRKITPAGVVTTLPLHIAGTNKPAFLNNPVGIKIDAFGNLIVVDAANERIVRITPDGALTPIAGSGAVGNNNGNANTPPTIGNQTTIPFSATVVSSINSTSPEGGITPVITALPANAAVCAGQPVQFNAAIPPGSVVNNYQWQVNGVNTGPNSPDFSSSALADGDIVNCIAANNSSCTVPKSGEPITVHVSSMPRISFIGNPTILQGYSVMLSPEIQGDIATFNWVPAAGLSNAGIPNPQASPPVTTTYYLTAITAAGCEITVPVTINVITPIKVPNAFTPNGDGFNDLWQITDLANYPNCTVDIFNRYGQALFHSKGYGKPWDGTFNGQNLQPGTYYYIINIKTGIKPLSGWVAIMR